MTKFEIWVRTLKNKIFEKITLIGIFLVFYYLIQVMMFYWLKLEIFPQEFLVDFTIILILASIALVFKSHRGSKIYLGFLMIMFSVLVAVNETLNIELNGDIFSIYDFVLVGEATNVFLVEYIHFDIIAMIIAIDIIYFIIVHMVGKAFFKPYIQVKGYWWKSLMTLTGFCLLFVLAVSQTKAFQTYNHLYNVSLFKRESISQYGMAGFYLKEIDIYFLDVDDDNQLNELKNELVIENPNYLDESDLDIPYKGLLKGKNVITIMVESGQSYAINEVLTPNLYRMTQEGLYFPNHYSENKTNVSELIGLLGSYPSEVMNPEINTYDFSFSLANQLKNEGYRTAYFHENVGSFYDRSDMMPQIGFDEIYLHDQLFPEEPIYGWSGDYTLDSRTMDRMLELMFTESDDTRPFYWFWTTLSMHGPYNYQYPSERGLNNIQKFTQLGYFDKIDQAEENGLWENLLENSSVSADKGRYRYYQAAVMDFDQALGKLFDQLEDEGILDDTVILLYGDHNVYYHKLHLRLNDVEEGDLTKVEMYKTMFAIYNPELTHAYLTNEATTDTTVSKFVTPYDIVPTFHHLLGLPYYKNFSLGESILSKEETVFYSNKMSAFFNPTYFSFSDQTITYPEDVDLSDESAVTFLNEAQHLRDQIIWLERWVLASETKKNE